MRVPPLVVVACSLAVAGCGSSGSSSTDASQPSAPKPAAGPRPTVAFVTPKQGADLNGVVKARVALGHFQLAPQAIGQAPRPNQGHLHFTMDGGKFDFPKYSGPNGLMGRKLGVSGHYSPSVTPFITYRNLPAGSHKLEVYLANNNHTSVGVEKTVKFTIR